MDDSHGGEPHVRRLQRDGSREADDDVRDAVRHQSGDRRADAQFTWVPAEFLTEQKVRGVAATCRCGCPTARTTSAFSRRSITKALADGLTFRPLAVTAKETLDWNKTRPAAELQALAEGAGGHLGAARGGSLAAWKAKQDESK